MEIFHLFTPDTGTPLTMNSRNCMIFVQYRRARKKWCKILLISINCVMNGFNIMMASSTGNIFRVTGLLCGEFTGPGEFTTQRPVTRSFDVFFDLRLNKRLSKQPWGWWFETLSPSLWRHRNDVHDGQSDKSDPTSQIGRFECRITPA